MRRQHHHRWLRVHPHNTGSPQWWAWRCACGATMGAEAPARDYQRACDILVVNALTLVVMLALGAVAGWLGHAYFAHAILKV